MHNQPSSRFPPMSAPHLRTSWRSFRAGLAFLHTEWLHLMSLRRRRGWDPKARISLEICREHGHRTSLEFNDEGNIQEGFMMVKRCGSFLTYEFASDGPYLFLGCRAH